MEYPELFASAMEKIPANEPLTELEYFAFKNMQSRSEATIYRLKLEIKRMESDLKNREKEFVEKFMVAPRFIKSKPDA